jgi:hypothetical protein
MKSLLALEYALYESERPRFEAVSRTGLSWTRETASDRKKLLQGEFFTRFHQRSLHCYISHLLDFQVFFLSVFCLNSPDDPFVPMLGNRVNRFGPVEQCDLICTHGRVALLSRGAGRSCFLDGMEVAAPRGQKTLP